MNLPHQRLAQLVDRELGVARDASAALGAEDDGGAVVVPKEEAVRAPAELQRALELPGPVAAERRKTMKQQKQKCRKAAVRSCYFRCPCGFAMTFAGDAVSKQKDAGVGLP